MQNITIRALTRKDRKTFGSLMVKLVNKTGRKDLIQMIPSVNTKDDNDEIDVVNKNGQILEMAFGLLQGMLSFIDEDLTEWFVSLVNEIETTEEFDELGFDIDLQVIDLLLDQDGFLNFFSKGSQVFSKIKGLAGRLKN